MDRLRQALTERPSLRPVLGNALRCRCPNCRQGPVFRGWLNNVLPRCPRCGLSFSRESGYYFVGMMMTYTLSALVLVAALLISLLLPDVGLSLNVKLAAWIAFAVLLVLAFVRPCYSLWLSLDFWVSPWKPEGPTSAKQG